MGGLYLQVVIWSTVNEDFAIAPVIISTSKHKGLRFDTIIPGGFGSASFTLTDYSHVASQLINNFPGYHVVIFDGFYRRVYEGRILSVDIGVDGLNINTEGYYAHGNDLTHGIIYPISTPKSISNIVAETVALADKWSTNVLNILTTSTDVTPQDFTGDKKLNDAINEVLKYGSDDTPPVPLHFAIWENRIAYLTKAPVKTDEPTWRVKRKDFNDSAGLAISVSRDSIYNKIQVLYDDALIGQTFTGWFEDAASQALYGVREGTVNIGSSTSTLATLVGDLYIANYSKPTYTARFGLQGIIASKNGADYPYMIRAGQLISLDDYDYNLVYPQQATGGIPSFGTSVVGRTTYNAESNTVDIELSTNSTSLDILLARLGMSASSIS